MQASVVVPSARLELIEVVLILRQIIQLISVTDEKIDVKRLPWQLHIRLIETQVREFDVAIGRQIAANRKINVTRVIASGNIHAGAGQVIVSRAMAVSEAKTTRIAPAPNVLP